jgi:transcriptional regulator with XRE-family HTH domain
LSRKPSAKAVVISKKSPNPVDRHVGSRVRMRRMLVGMSQEKLGDALGITFQQIQKYEKGTNRIGASRLHHIGRVLGVPIEFFYEGAPQIGGPAGMSESPAPAYMADFLSTAEGLDLMKAFVGIKDMRIRRRIVDLVRALASSGEE